MFLSSMLPLLREIALRRRFLLILPIAIIFPLGLAYAKFGTKTYVAKTLLQMQETSGDLPFSRDQAPSTRMQDRLAGLRALLMSDLVLHRVMRDIAVVPTTHKEVAAWTANFSAALSLDLVGSEFLEIQLKGTSPKGLGRQLEAVTARFVEALLSTDDVLSATEMLINWRKEDLEAAERSLNRLKSELADQPGGSPTAKGFGELNKELSEKSRLVAMARQKLNESRRKAMKAIYAKTRPSVQYRHVQAKNASGKRPPLAEALTWRQVGHDVLLMRSVGAYLPGAQANVDRLKKSVADARRQLKDPRHAQLVALEAAYESAKFDYEAVARRFGSRANTVRTQGPLRAPERIRLIDPPRDPEFSTTSALRIALGAALASILAAVGMAYVSEILDSTVRRPEQLEALTGVAVLSRIPRV